MGFSHEFCIFCGQKTALMAPGSISNIMKRVVFYISDGTGITARAFGRSLLTQFEHCEVEEITLSYVNTLDKAQEAIQKINNSFTMQAERPLIFATLVDNRIHNVLKEQSCGLLMDFFHDFIGPLEEELGQPSSHSMGRTHGVQDDKEYISRISAINYTLDSDDGNNIRHYDKADIILLGVSRCGKTPTSLYIALQFSVKVANYPFTADDMYPLRLADFLAVQQKKLIGLSIDPRRLHQIREERRPNSQYASLSQCQEEVAKVEALFQEEHIPFINSTALSIEEIATWVMASANKCCKL